MDITIMKASISKASGFTLIEALITISIVAILASIAVPSFSKMLENNRITAASNDFLSTLMYARSEAAKRSLSVSICTSSDSVTCDTSLDDYSKGWIVFTDCGNDGSLTTSATLCDLDGDGTNDPDLLLRVQAPIKGVSISSAKAPDFFTYRFSGRSINAGFNIGKDNATTAKQITVAITGRARLLSVDH